MYSLHQFLWWCAGMSNCMGFLEHQYPLLSLFHVPIQSQLCLVQEKHESWGTKYNGYQFLNWMQYRFLLLYLTDSSCNILSLHIVRIGMFPCEVRSFNSQYEQPTAANIILGGASIQGTVLSKFSSVCNFLIFSVQH
jgi:hypothetical protein